MKVDELPEDVKDIVPKECTCDIDVEWLRRYRPRTSWWHELQCPAGPDDIEDEEP